MSGSSPSEQFPCGVFFECENTSFKTNDQGAIQFAQFKPVITSRWKSKSLGRTGTYQLLHQKNKKKQNEKCKFRWCLQYWKRNTLPNADCLQLSWFLEDMLGACMSKFWCTTVQPRYNKTAYNNTWDIAMKKPVTIRLCIHSMEK